MNLHEREHTQPVPGGNPIPEDRVSARDGPGGNAAARTYLPGGRIKEEHGDATVWSRT